MSSNIVLRLPTGAPGALNKTAEGASKVTSPSVDWLAGTWYITHSSLPMWKSNRNIRIEYTPHSASAKGLKLEDVVHYQPLSSDKKKKVVGVDTASVDGDAGAWDWRGRGWLMIASSHWEVLGWGSLEPDADIQGDAAGWAVTYFSKTAFTPAGVDIYFRRKDGPGEKVVENIKKALTDLNNPEINKLTENLFQVKHD